MSDGVAQMKEYEEDYNTADAVAVVAYKATQPISCGKQSCARVQDGKQLS